jgi:prepilin peptidase CpaA
MINMIRNAIVNRKGATAMEYAVIAAGIVIAIAVAAETAGTLITNLFSTITSYLSQGSLRMAGGTAPAVPPPSRRRGDGFQIGPFERRGHLSMLTFAAIAAVCLLAFAAWRDVATRTIPDEVSLVLAALGLMVRAVEGGLPALGWSVAVAFLLFLLLLPLAMFGMLGGGDLKLASALALGLPPLGSYHFVVATAIAGGVLALIYLLLGRVLAAHRPVAAAQPRVVPTRRGAPLARRVLEAEAWRVRRRGPLPYGVAIATGGVLALFGNHGV